MRPSFDGNRKNFNRAEWHERTAGHVPPPPKRMPELDLWTQVEIPKDFVYKRVGDPDVTHELDPLHGRVLEDELQNIMIQPFHIEAGGEAGPERRRALEWNRHATAPNSVWQNLPEHSVSEAERLVSERFRSEAGDDLRNVLGLNVTKRLLNVFNPLLVKLEFSEQPRGTAFQQTVRWLGVISLRRVLDGPHNYVAQLRKVADFDRACGKRRVRMGDLKIRITPVYKFTECPPNLRTIYKEPKKLKPCKNPQEKVKEKKADTSKNDESNDKGELIKENANNKEIANKEATKPVVSNTATQNNAVTKVANTGQAKSNVEVKATAQKPVTINKSGNTVQNKSMVGNSSTNIAESKTADINKETKTTPTKNTENNKNANTSTKVADANKNVIAAQTKTEVTNKNTKITPTKSTETKKKNDQNNADDYAKSNTNKAITAQAKAGADKTPQTQAAVANKTMAPTKTVPTPAKEENQANAVKKTPTKTIPTKPAAKKVPTKEAPKNVNPAKSKTPMKRPKLAPKVNKKKRTESDFDELDDEDILALMSNAIILDECSGSDEN